MFLRLVLVGMVAAMGVTLPSRWGCQHWFDSAGVWASATLAEWDTWRPKDAAGRSHTYLRGKTECPECRLARERARSRAQDLRTAGRSVVTAAATGAIVIAAEPRAAGPPAVSAPAAQRKRVAIEPIQVAQDFVSGIASVLDAVPERPEEKPTPTAALDHAPVPTPHSPLPLEVKPRPTVDVTRTSVADEPIVATDNLELAILAELCREADRVSSEARCQPVADLPLPNIATIDETWICGEFGADYDDIPEAPQETALGTPQIQEEPRWERTRAAIGVIEPDFCSALDCKLEGSIALGQPADRSPVSPRVAALPDLPRDVFARAADEKIVSVPQDLAKTPPATKLVDLPRDVFAPAAPAVVIDREEVTVHTLPSSSTAVGQDASPSERWEHAVQLTRDAVYAWMSVLTKPGLVDLAASGR
jgi:hypothetical protein